MFSRNMFVLKKRLSSISNAYLFLRSSDHMEIFPMLSAIKKIKVFSLFLIATELSARYNISAIIEIERANSNPTTVLGRQHEKTWSRFQ